MVEQRNREFLEACFSDLAKAETMLRDTPDLISAHVFGGETALMYVATEDRADAVTFLLNNGANVNFQDDFGSTSLAIACSLGYDKVCDILIAHGANPNLADVNGVTPLHRAARNDSASLINRLIAAGAIVNALDNCKDTPLHAAAERKALDALKALLDAGANPLGDKAGYCSPLDYAEESGSAEVVEELKKRIALMPTSGDSQDDSSHNGT
ncbi:MAG: ankyrin repeat domain-containing protein [Phycisphaerales bacterium]|nr:ankyrin repeat domain-containing protein [Phycisphaerales bacterium]MCB9856037.1 ankyrin repeat domain-containing protein [Phycisphaerales bacterium]MCB9863935.1 ankyrin repeat domain-containing protein [Phycisphaerales bacterium]